MFQIINVNSIIKLENGQYVKDLALHEESIEFHSGNRIKYLPGTFTKLGTTDVKIN